MNWDWCPDIIVLQWDVLYVPLTVTQGHQYVPLEAHTVPAMGASKWTVG